LTARSDLTYDAPQQLSPAALLLPGHDPLNYHFLLRCGSEAYRNE